MSNENQENLDTVRPLDSMQTIQELQDKLSHANSVIVLQQQQNRKLNEKMIYQELLNTQLSNFHLTSYFQDKEIKNLSTKKEEELSKAQEHIMILGQMLLKNKITIAKLKKYKNKEDCSNTQISDLIAEKEFLWDIILQAHFELTQQPNLESDSKYDKAMELVSLIKSSKKSKLKP